MWCDLCNYGSEAFRPPPSGICPQCRRKACRFVSQNPMRPSKKRDAEIEHERRCERRRIDT